MNGRALIDLDSTPRLAPHMRLRHDKAREQWTIQAPERSFVLDQVAHAIVSRCDGMTSLGAVVDELCAAFPGAPRELIEKDVITLAQNFVDKNVMQT
ncbi:MAG: pyrroloquinoline quinone biosynthesis peptide chaperone PqqD [Pseudomonadota bacterium]